MACEARVTVDVLATAEELSARGTTAPPLSGQAIAVCCADFGWGSAGKLSAILSALTRDGSMRTVILGTTLGRPVLSGISAEAWYEEWPPDTAALRALLDRHGVTAAVVVLDPDAADSLMAVGIPTIYVDSIPYLWTPADKLPLQVTAYCAQRSPDLPQPAAAALGRVARLFWIEAVVAEPPSRSVKSGSRTAILNFGGLHSPVNPGGNPHYLALVAPAAIQALADAGYEEVEVCGNLGRAELGGLRADPRVSVHVSPRAHPDFTAALRRADLLLTSPGLTTLLEASAIGIPTLCLPPQNLSQVFNGARFASAFGTECHVPWPGATLDPARLDEVRLAGEEAALRYIDERLSMLDPASVYPSMRKAISQGIRAVRRRDGDWGILAEDAGTSGADQVAALVRQLATQGEIPRRAAQYDDGATPRSAAHPVMQAADNGDNSS
jgi:hydroxymethylcytosylglucuronate/cytosylglucuronate synthase